MNGSTWISMTSASGTLDILATVERVVDSHDPAELTLENVYEAERWAREQADRLLANGHTASCS